MDYPRLKNLMRKYLGDVVGSSEFGLLFFDRSMMPNYSIVCSNNTHLHKCVMLTNKYPKLNDYLEEYFKIYDNVNETNVEGQTALHLAVHNSKTDSTLRRHKCNLGRTKCTERTVEILINAGTNVNLQDNYGQTALHYACSYFGSSKRTIEILIIAESDVFNLKDICGRTPYDYFSKSLKDHCQIDEATQTIGIKIGRLTKCAKK